MEVQIHIPRPLLTLTIVLIVVLFVFGVIEIRLPWTNNSDAVVGGQTTGETIAGARKTIERESVRRAVLERQEEILRYQFLELEKQIGDASAPEILQVLRDARIRLLAIIKERSAAEKMIGDSLLALWEAEGTLYRTDKVEVTELFEWPVQPELGISAKFLDKEYKERFGLEHFAIDIPTEQGTTVIAVAAGTVEKVALNGFGYSFITLSHGDGLQTTYGHISAALVEEGDEVSLGQAIAKSGGQPGTEGAGLLTTGPHLHFSVRVDGALTDPLQFLPRVRGI